MQLCLPPCLDRPPFLGRLLKLPTPLANVVPPVGILPLHSASKACDPRLLRRASRTGRLLLLFFLLLFIHTIACIEFLVPMLSFFPPNCWPRALADANITQACVVLADDFLLNQVGAHQSLAAPESGSGALNASAGGGTASRGPLAPPWAMAL